MPLGDNRDLTITIAMLARAFGRVRALTAQAMMAGRRCLKGIASILRLVGCLQAPLFAGGASFALLAFTPQVRDVYRAVLEDPRGVYTEPLTAIFSLFVLSYSLRLCCRYLALEFLSKSQSDAVPRSVGRAMGLIAAMPWVGLTFGLNATLHRSATSSGPASRSMGFAFAAACIASFVVALSFARRISVRVPKRRFQVLTLSTSGVFLALSFLLSSTTALARFLGPIALVNLFSTILAVVLTAASAFNRRRGFPVAAAAVVAALTFSGLDLNDDHEVRTFQSDVRNGPINRFSPPAGMTSFTTDDFLRLWLHNRGDYADYEKSNRPYPIYIVAAQGGGIYAAYHTATFLAAMQDRCPGFAQHVFAISAVSGGSLGASVFAGLTKTYATNDRYRPCKALENGGALREIGDRIFGKDLLSPLVGALLFPDFLQSFLPLSVPPFDRARRLEAAFEQAWDDEVPEGKGILARSVFSFWSLQAPVPALVLNTTAVETGEQVVVASLPWDVWHERNIRDWLVDGTDMSISTASVLSARFPWATPAGWLYNRKGMDGNAKNAKVKIHLVDGGYFDNSGTEMGKTIADALRRASSSIGWNEKYEVKLIVLSGASPGSHDDPVRFSELAAPIRTFLSVRERRSALAQGRAEDETCSTPINFEISTFQSYRSCLDFGYDLPLGWRLSAFARKIIADHTAMKGRCWPSDMYDPAIPKDVRFRVPNVCTIMEMMRDLTL